jgi:predicted MarR family transcription regulator
MARTVADEPGPSSVAYMSDDSLTGTLTRLELGFMRASEALASWAVEAHKHLGVESLSWQEVSVLHCVRLRGEHPTLAELLLFLHRHDLSALQYCLRKLERHGLVRRSRGVSKREIAFSITDEGRRITDAYVAYRRDVLVGLCRQIKEMEESMAVAASVLERLIGVYDQATQTVYNDRITEHR